MQHHFHQNVLFYFHRNLYLLIWKSKQKKNVFADTEKHVVTENFYDSVMDRESKTTTTIGNGVSLPHGSPTAVNESKVGIAILKNPIMWDNEQVQVVFLLAFRLSTRDEISRIQMFYKEYVTLIDSEEKLEKLKSMKSNIELYKYLIQ